MDGARIPGCFVYPRMTQLIEGTCVTSTSMKHFHFTKLELTGKIQPKSVHISEFRLSSVPLADDDSTLAESRKLKNNLGMIEVRLYRVARGKATSVIDHSSNFNVQPIHEKSKKAGCHRVSYVLLQVPSSRCLLRFYLKPP